MRENIAVGARAALPLNLPDTQTKHLNHAYFPSKYILRFSQKAPRKRYIPPEGKQFHGENIRHKLDAQHLEPVAGLRQSSAGVREVLYRPDAAEAASQAVGNAVPDKTWGEPAKWQRELRSKKKARRVFTCSESDFFHVKADARGKRAQPDVIRDTPNLVYLILTKRPDRIARHLPTDWPYRNVWLGVSTGCQQTLNKMDTLCRIPVHPEAVRFVSAEPLLESLVPGINLDGFGWVIAGGESGSGAEYHWDRTGNWRKEFSTDGRRYMAAEWAEN